MYEELYIYIYICISIYIDRDTLGYLRCTWGTLRYHWGNNDTLRYTWRYIWSSGIPSMCMECTDSFGETTLPSEIRGHALVTLKHFRCTWDTLSYTQVPVAQSTLIYTNIIWDTIRSVFKISFFRWGPVPRNLKSRFCGSVCGPPNKKINLEPRPSAFEI